MIFSTLNLLYEVHQTFILSSMLIHPLLMVSTKKFWHGAMCGRKKNTAWRVARVQWQREALYSLFCGQKNRNCLRSYLARWSISLWPNIGPKASVHKLINNSPWILSLRTQHGIWYLYASIVLAKNK